MRIPNRAEVTRTFTEPEAFSHAAELYRDWITANEPPASAELVRELEQGVFQPALELQVAGLSLIAPQDLSTPDHMVVAFATYAVDLQLWGWFAAVNGHPRVAFSLIRSALEAVIFGLAAAHDYDAFKAAWNRRSGTTGGAVLRAHLKNLHQDTRWLLNTAWKLMVGLGHASSGPVLSALTMFRDGEQTRRGLTFAGQFAGPLDARQLEACANAFCITALSATRLFALSIRPLLSTSDEWSRRYEELQANLDEVVPLPPHLEGYAEEHWRRFGRPPKREDA